MSSCVDRKMTLFFSYVVATCLDVGALYLMFFPLHQSPLVNIALAMGLHLCCVAVFLVVPKSCGVSMGPERRFYFYLAFVFVLFLPGLGVAGTFFSCLASKHLLSPKGLAGEFERRDFLPYYAEFLEDTDDMDAFLEDEVNVQPILDIINGNDPAMKRGAIKVLRNRGTPEAVRMLKRCLSDTDLEVRFYAHTALGRLEEEHVESIDRAKQQAQDGTEASLLALAEAYESYANSDLLSDDLRADQLRIARDIEKLKAHDGEEATLMVLAEAYESYANSDLLSDDLRVGQLNSARKLYEQVAEKKPDDLRVALHIGQLYHETGELNAAARWLQKAWQGETYLEASLSLCRLLYERREMQALRGLTKRMAAHELPETTDTIALSQFMFWTAGWNANA